MGSEKKKNPAILNFKCTCIVHVLAYIRLNVMTLFTEVFGKVKCITPNWVIHER